MPGKIGVKLIARKSLTGKYYSVRELVFALLEKSNGMISKVDTEKAVKKEYPKSSFLSKDGRGGHFTWYKHQWNKMKLEHANFTLKESKTQEPTGESDERSDEGKTNKVKQAKRVEPTKVGKSASRGKSRRVSIHKKKRSMDVKAGKKPVQRKRDSKVSGQPSAA